MMKWALYQSAVPVNDMCAGNVGRNEALLAEKACDMALPKELR